MPDNNNPDPWKGSGKKQGPPDLDELLRNFIKKINTILGSKQVSNHSNKPRFEVNSLNLGIGLGLAFFLVLWFLAGIFIVSPAEQAVILRFGKYVETLGPGPHWIPRLLESKYVLNVQQIAEFPYQAEMLTKDENIVSVEMTVQYRIDNPRDYLFNVTDPNSSLRQAAASALRQVVGNTTLDDILTSGRQKVAQEVAEQITKTLSIYQPGIQIADVTLQSAKPPEAVTDAFDDAIKAREDEQRFINQAYAYAEKITPIGHGQASRLLEAAAAYQQQVVLDAKAATAKYLAVLPVYQQNPQVTRQRMYIDAIESVLTKSNKILVDVKGGQNIIYLPLDKIVAATEKRILTEEAEPENNSSETTTASGSASTTTSTPLMMSGRNIRSLDLHNYPTRGAYNAPN
jgi:membrane protease subunit HflK